MNVKEAYEYWLNDPYFDENIKKELREIAGDEKAVEERFYRKHRGTSRDNWGRNKPYEYLYGEKGNTGTG